jgi:hypothetical protein
MKFEQIKKKIKEGDQYFLFNMKPEKPYLLAKAKTKTELKKILKEKVIKNPEKYRDSLCILMYFEFRKPNNKFTFGELIVRLQVFKIMKNLSLEGEKKSCGYVFFHNDYLEEEGFSYTYLRNISYLYKLNKIHFSVVGQPGYNELKGEIRHALHHYEKLKKK